MTAQYTERLFLRGEKLSLCTEPLAPYLESGANQITFDANTSACWRGYQGTWAIESDRLYLVKLQGGSVTNEGWVERSLADLFPQYPDGVFAHWYTGELRCPGGKRLQITHRLYSVLTEFDVFIAVNKGVVTKERVVMNTLTPLEDDDPAFEAEYQKLMNLPRNAHLRKKD